MLLIAIVVSLVESVAIAIAATDAAVPKSAVARHQAVAGLLSEAAGHVEQRAFDAASAALERALRIHPGDAEIWNLLGQVRWHQGRYDQAQALAEKSNTLSARNRNLQARNRQLLALVEQRDAGNEHADDVTTADGGADSPTNRQAQPKPHPSPTEDPGADPIAARQPQTTEPTPVVKAHANQQTADETLSRSKYRLAQVLNRYDNQHGETREFNARFHDESRQVERLIAELRAVGYERRHRYRPSDRSR